jgi:hypothetical protein
MKKNLSKTKNTKQKELPQTKIIAEINSYGVDCSGKLGLSEENATTLIKRAYQSGETKIKGQTFPGAGLHQANLSNGIEDWINDRYLVNCIELDSDEYAENCINALKITTKLAATDYGSSRQRDFGQIWGDQTRGYLGEFAFAKFLKKYWSIEAQLGHERGDLKEYKPMDIHKVKFPDRDWKDPGIKIGIKTTKFQGIWLDLPNDQFNSSDIHVFVKLSVDRDHLFTFFKELGVFEDKIFKKGKDLGILDKDTANKISESISSFSNIKAYICGFVLKSSSFNPNPYSGTTGRPHFTVKGWNGPYKKDEDFKKIEQIEGLQVLKIKGEEVKPEINFLNIEKFSHKKGYLFNSGNLSWKKKDWDKIVNML